MRRYRKKNKFLLITILVLCISIGYALLSSSLSILGIGGIKNGTWDIHWKDDSVEVSSGSVTSATPVVSGTNDDTVTFSTTLELPGDYFEFTVDAINEGSVDGMIDEINTTITDSNGDPVEFEDYIKFSVTYSDNTPVRVNQILGAGQREKYKLRLEFDSEATEVPEEDITYNVSYQVTYIQPDQDRIMPVRYAEFDTGSNVNVKIKTLAGDTIDANYPLSTNDENIISFERTTTAPDLNSMTDANIISSENSRVPIYAWFDNGKIYYYTEAEEVYLNADASYMFNNLKSVTNIDTSYNTKNTTNMYFMFGYCNELSSLNLSGWNTKQVENMSYMFANCSTLTSLDLSSFDTRNVTTMSSMFYYCTSLETVDVSSFNTSNVLYMGDLFYRCESLTSLDLSHFDTSKATSIGGLVAYCNSLTELNLSNWNFVPANLTNLNNITYGVLPALKKLKMDNVNLKVNSLTNAFTSQNVIEELSLKNVDLSTVTSFENFFNGMANLKKLTFVPTTTTQVTNMKYMFYGCSKLEEIDVDVFDTRNVTNMYYLFNGCSSLTSLDLSGWDTSKVTDFNGIVGSCSNLEELNMSNFNFSAYTQTGLFMNVSSGGFSKLKKLTLDNAKLPTSMNYGFGGLGTLEEISLKNVNTSNVTDMAAMFNNDDDLTILDLESFDTSKVTAMGSMFYGCSSLQTIHVSDDFVTDKVTSSGGMFYNCISLVGGNGTVFDSNHIDKEYAHYDYGSIDPGYFDFSQKARICTVTFNANGGTVNPTTKKVVCNTKLGTTPTPVNDDITFDNWYTELPDGIKVTEDTIIDSDITLYAHWLSVKDIEYNANGGMFDNNQETHDIEYSFDTDSSTQYSHTPNVDDSGVASGRYTGNLSRNDVVTIPGASKIKIEVWYSTETDYDWLAIYPAGVTPSSSNTGDATISGGKLSGGQTTTKPADDSSYHKVFIADGDTAQFYFVSSASYHYYGYYAIVTKVPNYVGDKEYKEPSKASGNFIGWTTNEKRDVVYENEKQVIENLKDIGNNTLYAKWYDSYTITFDANGGTVDPSSKNINSGDGVGELPIPTRTGYGFTGWYTDEFAGIKVDEDYIPSSNQTLWAHWTEIEAMFDQGEAFNTKIKALAPEGNTIEEVRRSTTAPDVNSMTEANIVSHSTSKVPIYAWYDKGTIYWWSQASQEYTYYDASYMFSYLRDVTYIDTSFNTSLTQNMSYMFQGLASLEEIDVSGFDTRNVTNISYIFAYSTALKKLDLSTFNTENMTKMRTIYTSYVSGLYQIEELNLSNFDFTNIDEDRGNTALMDYLTASDFEGIHNLIVENAIFPANMRSAFREGSHSTILQKISIKGSDTSRVTDMGYAFAYNRGLKEVDLTGIDTSKVTDMQYMFYDDQAVEELDLTMLDTRSVTNMSYMFWQMKNLNSLNLSGWNTSQVTTMYNMFNTTGTKLTYANLTGWDFRKLSHKFSDVNFYYGSCYLKTLILDNAIFGSDMSSAFNSFNQLENISLQNVDTSNVTNMRSMFGDCRKLQTIDVSSFNTKNVTNMSYMFGGNSILTTIYASKKFVTGGVSDSSSMFYNSPNIVGGMGTVFDSTHIDKAYAHIDYGEADPGYFTDEAETYKIIFDPNEGEVYPTYKTIIAGDPIREMPIPKRNNYVFTGWYLGLTDGIKIEENYVPSSNIVLRAHWEPAKMVVATFNPNGGQVSPTSREVLQGKRIGALPIPTKENKAFDGWYTELNGGIKITKSYIMTTNQEFFAHWTDGAPTCEIATSREDDHNGWYNKNVEMYLVTHGSVSKKGLDIVQNSTNGKSNLIARTEGNSITYYGYVENELGSNTCSKTIKLDKTAPTEEHYCFCTSGMSREVGRSFHNGNKTYELTQAQTDFNTYSEADYPGKYTYAIMISFYDKLSGLDSYDIGYTDIVQQDSWNTWEWMNSSAEWQTPGARAAMKFRLKNLCDEAGNCRYKNDVYSYTCDTTDCPEGENDPTWD